MSASWSKLSWHFLVRRTSVAPQKWPCSVQCDINHKSPIDNHQNVTPSVLENSPESFKHKCEDSCLTYNIDTAPAAIYLVTVREKNDIEGAAHDRVSH